MENRIKERLTGAAIVVALLVLLVPEMFRGRPPAAPAAADSGAGPPVRSYTIELRDRAAAAPASPAASAPLTSDRPALATPPEPAPSPPAAATTAPPPSAATTPEPAPAATPEPAAPAASTGGTGAERYQVQLGLFASRANADRLAAKVNRQGIRVTVSGPDARNLYRVHTSTYASREAAQGIQQKLQALGFTAALTPQR
jgi:DedD protein